MLYDNVSFIKYISCAMFFLIFCRLTENCVNYNVIQLNSFYIKSFLFKGFSIHFLYTLQFANLFYIFTVFAICLHFLQDPSITFFNHFQKPRLCANCMLLLSLCFIIQDPLGEFVCGSSWKVKHCLLMWSHDSLVVMCFTSVLYTEMQKKLSI